MDAEQNTVQHIPEGYVKDVVKKLPVHPKPIITSLGYKRVQN